MVNLEQTLELTPEDLGWVDGYNDRPNTNPFDPGTEEHEQYEAGYAVGSDNN